MGWLWPKTATAAITALRIMAQENDAPYLAGHKEAIDLFFRAMLEADR
jgi:hypothetical protein